LYPPGDGTGFAKWRDNILRNIAAAAVAFLTLSFGAQAQAQDIRILFFEGAAAPSDRILSGEPTGFSKLVEILRNDSMLVASMSSGEITGDKLASYEIVVLHVSPERPFAEPEISALVAFVAQRGGVVFVDGGSPHIVNPLIEIFGVSMDESSLLDTSSAMDDSADARRFVLTRFPLPPLPGDKSKKIEKIGFYGGGPLVLSKDAIAIVTGDEDSYSDNGRFSIGSAPPVAAAAFLGRGAIFVASDRAIFSNANIESYQNAEWASSVFQNLSRTQRTGLEREQSLIGLQRKLADLRKGRDGWTQERAKNEADLKAAYKKKKQLQRKLEKSAARSDDLDEELKRLMAENDSLNASLSRYTSITRLRIVGGALASVLLISFLAGLLIGRRSGRNRV
jgi:hypothetical protein